jgi:hypothetical protein
MSLIALPTTSQNKSRWMTWLLVPAAVVLALVTFWVLAGKARPSILPGNPTFHRVGVMDLDVKINKDGELQAINAIEIQ